MVTRLVGPGPVLFKLGCAIWMAPVVSVIVLWHVAGKSNCPVSTAMLPMPAAATALRKLPSPASLQLETMSVLAIEAGDDSAAHAAIVAANDFRMAGTLGLLLQDGRRITEAVCEQAI